MLTIYFRIELPAKDVAITFYHHIDLPDPYSNQDMLHRTDTEGEKNASPYNWIVLQPIRPILLQSSVALR